MDALQDLKKNFDIIEQTIGYRFRDRSLLQLAFTHCSFVNEQREVSAHNERLEFLGDAVLELIVSEFLYRRYGEMPEGDLSFLRARLVEASSCAEYLRQVHLEEYLLLGRGEKRNQERGREGILADLFEAIVGAVYLDGGLEAAEAFLFSHFSEKMDAILETPVGNYKALLQDYCQKRFQTIPLYAVVSAVGPDHRKLFCVEATVKGESLGRGEGYSKKVAEQAAAKEALERLEERHGDKA